MIPYETLVGWGATGAMIVGHVFIANYRINQNSDEIKDMWNWKKTFEADMVERRFDIQKQFGRLEAQTEVHDKNYEQLLSILNEIKNVTLSEMKQDIREIKNQRS